MFALRSSSFERVEGGTVVAQFDRDRLAQNRSRSGTYDLLLSQIIICATREEEQRSRIAPWNFAAVCRRWRSSCLSNPNIWTYFDNYRSHTCHAVGGVCSNSLRLAQCVLQLQRSKTCLLDVEIDMAKLDCMQSRSYIRTVAAHSRRWRSLSLRIRDMDVFTDLMPLGLNLSSLQSITYKCHRREQYVFILPLNNRLDPSPAAFSSARNLTSLTIDSWSDGSELGNSYSPDFRFSQLLELNFINCYLCSHTVLLILKRCHSLQRFRWDPDMSHAEFGQFMGDFESEDLVLEQLTHFDISTYHPRTDKDHVLQALPLIRMPNLRTLCVRYCMDSFVMEILNSLINRSDCQVQFFLAPFPASVGSNIAGTTEADIQPAFLELLGNLTTVDT